MNGERHGFLSSARGDAARLEWRSLAVGAAATLAIMYVGAVRPAQRQCDGLERQLATLSDVVARLESVEGNVSATNRLLAALEDQARQVATADTALERLATVHDRLVAQAQQLERATTTVAHVEALGRSLEVIDRHELESAQAAAERMARLGSALAAQAADIDVAQEQLDRLVDLKSNLVQRSRDLAAAETTLVHLDELTDWLAKSATVVGDLRHFVVDVVLLQPSVERARQALEPVVSLTRTASSAAASR